MRKAGILMPISALPSDFGIGDFGKSGYEFIDMLKRAGISIWQILPLNPLGYGNSPYQPYSSYAGDEIYIDLYQLKEEGYILEQLRTNRHRGPIQYGQVRKFKENYLKMAYHEFFSDLKENEEYQKFIAQNWVYPYAVFIAFKKKNKDKSWNQWSKEEQNWQAGDTITDKSVIEEINYQLFVQFMFYKQWMKLKKYANDNGVEIMGDVPFYVGFDSADVWQEKEGFLLDEKNVPTFIAGVPPDYFSKTGQRWGNPIYDWDYMEKTGFDFWIKRLAYSATLYDIVRIDHFRAFDTFWKIPASCETAVEGEWIEAPGYAFFQKLLEKEKDIHIVVEDLGDLREEVLTLRDAFGFKGMNVVQFNFLNEEDEETNRVAYTGTHDNTTTMGWYKSLPLKMRFQVKRLMKKRGLPKGSIAYRMVAYTMGLKAEYAIIPMQDFLDLPQEARINTPGTVGSPNWEWKLENLQEFDKKTESIRALLQKTGRI